MRTSLLSIAVLCSLVLVAQLAYAAPVKVTGVEFLPGKTVRIPITAQKIAPQASVQADVVFKHGQSRIKIKFSGMKPAILLGGDVTSYVVWAITYDGRAANLGELRARKSSGTETFYVGLKGFALIVTAEPYYMVARPSELVMFVGGGPEKDKSRSRSYTFSELARAPKHAKKSIAELEWDSNMDLGLLQARKAYELARRHNTGAYAKEALAMAGSELKAAEAIAADKPGSNKIDHPARNAVQLSNTAINIAVRAEAALAFREIMMEQERKVRAANERSEVLEFMAASLSNQTTALRASLSEVESENIELQSLLQDALSKIATARIEAAKIVLTLPGILFQTDESKLKPEAELALAKLSGILMVCHRATVAVGGYTDSTGNADQNQDLSQRRADAVRTLLVDQGIADGRLSAQGFGDQHPVADNSTAEGRTKNRRVELIIIARRG